MSSIHQYKTGRTFPTPTQLIKPHPFMLLPVDSYHISYIQKLQPTSDILPRVNGDSFILRKMFFILYFQNAFFLLVNF